MGVAFLLMGLILARFLRSAMLEEYYGNAEWALLVTIILAQVKSTFFKAIK
jgi:hypothetical protein